MHRENVILTLNAFKALISATILPLPCNEQFKLFSFSIMFVNTLGTGLLRYIHGKNHARVTGSALSGAKIVTHKQKLGIH